MCSRGWVNMLIKKLMWNTKIFNDRSRLQLLGAAANIQVADNATIQQKYLSPKKAIS